MKSIRKHCNLPLNLSIGQYFRNTYLKPSIDEGYIEFTLPNEKQSKLQKYRLTAKGLALKEFLIKQQ